MYGASHLMQTDQWRWRIVNRKFCCVRGVYTFIYLRSTNAQRRRVAMRYEASARMKNGDSHYSRIGEAVWRLQCDVEAINKVGLWRKKRVEKQNRWNAKKWVIPCVVTPSLSTYPLRTRSHTVKPRARVLFGHVYKHRRVSNTRTIRFCVQLSL